MTAKPSNPRPRTGTPRKTRMPLSIDLLPMDVLEAIKLLRSQFGLTWPEIERLSSLPFGEKWKENIGSAGFVNWGALSERVLNRFPNHRLPHSNLHRWYDIRVDQTQREVLARAEQARVIATSFASGGIEGADEAVLNAARDLIFEMLQSGDIASRAKTTARLIALAEVMTAVRANVIKERKVVTEERRITVLEKDAALKRKRLEQETESVAKKLNKGGVITREDINRLRERTFGLPPIAKAG